MKLPVAPDSSQWKIGETVTLVYPVPHLETGTVELYLQDDFVRLAGNPVLLKRQAAPAGNYDFQPAAWMDVGRRLRIKLGDGVHSPIFWHGARSVSLDRFHEFDQAAANGFKNFRIAVSFDEFWRGDGQYDFSKFDSVMNYVLTVVPDAVFSIQIYAHMPEWWLKLNPDDLTKHAHQRPRYADRDKQALASKKWLADAEAPIKALIEHLRKRSFAPRIWGMLVAESGNGEWFWTNVDGEMKRSCPGYSAADYATFRSYLQEKYADDAALAKAWNMPGVTLDSAPMPDPERANRGRVGELLDAERDRQLVDWFEFRNRSLGEAIIALCKIIKDNTQGKLLTGAYYGYSIELAENGGRPLTITGHNAFEAVARSPYVDFVQAPSRYTYRKTGMSDALMQAYDTYSAYGKAVYCEQDIRTAYGGSEADAMNIYVGRPDTPLESVGHIDRGFGMALATGTGMYWFDISNSALSEQALLEAVKKQLEIYDKLPAVQGLTPIEVAVVSDRDSIYYAPNANERSAFTGAISGLFKRFNELAVPFRSLSVNTLLDDAAAVPAHKFYIMLPTLMLTKHQREALLKRFEREKAAVLWLYTAGCDYPEQGPTAENCADFLGIATRMEDKKQRPSMRTTPEFGSLNCMNYNTSSPWFYPVGGFDAVLGRDADGQPMLVRKNLRGATHYFSTLMNLPMELYAGLLKDARVQRYRREIGDPVWVGNDVIFLSAKSGGPKSFVLPANLRARAIVGPFRGALQNGESFEAVAGLTYGFLIER